jgi:hypothetical protein
MSICWNNDVLGIRLETTSPTFYSTKRATAMLATFAFLSFARHFFAFNKEKNGTLLASYYFIRRRSRMVFARTHDQ